MHLGTIACYCHCDLDHCHLSAPQGLWEVRNPLLVLSQCFSNLLNNVIFFFTRHLVTIHMFTHNTLGNTNLTVQHLEWWYFRVYKTSLGETCLGRAFVLSLDFRWTIPPLHPTHPHPLLTSFHWYFFPGHGDHILCTLTVCRFLSPTQTYWIPEHVAWNCFLWF